jgi:hypothetical protein
MNIAEKKLITGTFAVYKENSVISRFAVDGAAALLDGAQQLQATVRRQ